MKHGSTRARSARQRVVRRPPIVPVRGISIEDRNVIRSPKFARLVVWHRDRGVCAVCGVDLNEAKNSVILIGEFLKAASAKKTMTYVCPTVFGAWQVDHIFPLWLVERRRAGAFKYWALDNLQTICGPCHDKKNDTEAGQRGKINRIKPTDGLRKAKLNKKDRYLRYLARRARNKPNGPKWL